MSDPRATLLRTHVRRRCGMAVDSIVALSGLAHFVAELARSATSRGGVPVDLSEYARQATLRRFSCLEGPLTAAERRRAAAYFRGVVRRRSIRSRGDSLQTMRQLYLVVSIAEDLRSVGRTPQEIMSEIQADYGQHVSLDAIERLRQIIGRWESPSGRRGPQNTVETMTSLDAASNAQTRDRSKTPPAEPHTSTTTQASRPSTLARSA